MQHLDRAETEQKFPPGMQHSKVSRSKKMPWRKIYNSHKMQAQYRTTELVCQKMSELGKVSLR